MKMSKGGKKVNGPKKTSPARKPLGTGSTVPGSKGKFLKGKKMTKKGGTS